MGQVTAILRKDIRRLRPQLAAALAITVLIGWVDSATSSGASAGIPEILWALCWICLSASVIQQERLPGDCQYWLARPYDWRCLLAAKALFVVAFAALPLVMVKAVVLTVNGISPFPYAWMVLLTALLFIGVVALTSATLAALTSSLLQFLWAFLALAAVVTTATFLGGGSASWGPVEWVRRATAATLIAAVTVPVLLLQYSRRATFLGRAILGGGVLIAVTAPVESAWHTVWGLQSKLESSHRDPTEVAIAFDTTARPRIRYGEAPYFPRLQYEGIYLPVRVNGIPSGAALINKRLSVTIETGDARRWTSGWTAEGALAGANRMEDVRLIHADGPAWQYFIVDRAFYQSIKETPVRIHVSVALVLLGGIERAGISANGRTNRLPMEGICRVGPMAIPLPAGVRGIDGVRHLGVFCAWPRPGPERAYLRTVRSASGETSQTLLSAGGGESLSIDQSVWQHGAATLSVRGAEPQLTVETWRAESWIERSFEIDGVRLGGYSAPRATDPQ